MRLCHCLRTAVLLLRTAVLLLSPSPTPSQCYLNVALDMRRVPLEDVPYLPLLTRMMSEIIVEAARLCISATA